MKKYSNLRIAIIGAGPAGLVAGRELLKQGFDNFTIFEKSDAAGGTWHNHSYPGLCCDVMASVYTFEGEANEKWTHNFVEQREIEEYLQRSARKFGLESHFRFNTNIKSVVYHEPGTWTLTDNQENTWEFDIVINAMGNQHTPQFPNIRGMDTFEGESWHSTLWRHDVSLKGKKVIVVGSAAAAVQIVPEVAKEAGHLTVLQRTPNWILSRGLRAYSPVERQLFKLSSARESLKSFHTALVRMTGAMFQLGTKSQKYIENKALEHIENQISDPVLREQVTPTSRFGCKRPLMSDDFYPALQKPNVTLLTTAAEKVHAKGLTTVDGEDIEADVIIYCTGYEVMDYDRIDIRGSRGQSMGSIMKKEPRAYKGLALPGFPNYFFALGPNSLCPAGSFFELAEENLRCIIRMLQGKEKAGASSLDVREERYAAYNRWIDKEKDKFSWGVSSCNSYYQTADGHAPFLFPGGFSTFQKQRRHTRLTDFKLGFPQEKESTPVKLVKKPAKKAQPKAKKKTGGPVEA
ncbi:MAG: NAD(P)/FAD-dependent oxidoreductase [Pseudomonadales bacterium]|nr:NAD(P)/FAD-dependent oxidoreductase [Pseudomonadales bacterium]